MDNSTQTPRDEGGNKDEVKVDDEKTAGSTDSVPGENKQGSGFCFLLTKTKLKHGAIQYHFSSPNIVNGVI